MKGFSEADLQKALQDNPELSLADTDYSRRNPPPPASPPPRAHKYGAEKVEINGIRFDSKREARYYQQLALLEKEGKIQGLEIQPEFEIFPAFTDSSGTKHRAIKYRADFKFFDLQKDQWVVVDVKGYETPVFKIKMKMFLKQYPQYIYEIWT